MTDKKISQLTAAGTVNDADIFPMVQSGDTKYGTIAQMKAAVAPSAATESTAGIIEIANQAEAESQTNDDKAMTALKVQQFLDVGIVIDGATGGNQGDGTINAKGLFVNGEPVSGGGGLELIATSTPTGVATVTFSSIPQTYKSLFLEFSNISCNTATRYLRVDFRNPASGILTPVGYKVAGTTVSSLTGSALGTATTMSATEFISGSFYVPVYTNLTGLLEVGVNPYNRLYTATYNRGSAEIAHITGSFYTTAFADNNIDSIQLLWNSTGNFDDGKINLYGIK